MRDELLTLTHGGEHQKDYLNAVTPPVFLNSLHIFDSMEDYLDHDETGAYVYGRVSNPTVHILEEKVAALEKGSMAVAFASGMAAFSAAVLAVCGTGSHIICLRNVYGPVKQVLNDYFIPQMGMSVSYWDGRSLDELEGLIRDNTALMVLESPATLVFSVFDIEGTARIARAHGVKTYIDNSYCTPLYQKPLTLGIDIVMHTMSKYIGGHSDIIGGILTVRDEQLGKTLTDNIRQWFGGILGPMEAWLAIRGLRTLDLRVERHQKTAMAVAAYLENHPKVEEVYYTGLASHPQADLIKKQQTGHTGLMSFRLKAGPEAAMRLVDELKIFEIGCSWGGFESLAIAPLIRAGEEELKLLGLGEKGRGLIRIHCGLEGTEALLADLEQAFAKI